MDKRRPIILGIVGDSAAGKTTITRGLMDILGTKRVTHVCADDYHKYDRHERARLGITPLHPDCNYIDVMEQHVELLHYGQPILKPVYDHSNGTLARPEYVEPGEFVIIEGLHGFSTANLRKFFDVKVYLAPPEELRRTWKIRRDTSNRGYTADQVRREMELREPDSRQFIRPQREYADIVVCFHQPVSLKRPEVAGNHLNVRLVLRPMIVHPDLTYLSGNGDCGIRLELGRDDARPVDFLDVDGDVASEHAAELESAIWQHMPELRPVRAEEFGDYQDRSGMHHSHPLALTQLLITYHLLRKFNDASQLPSSPLPPALDRVHSAPPAMASTQ